MQHFGVCKKRAFGIPMPLPGLLNDKYRQAVRIMKITAFILLVCTLHVSAAGYSQSITLSEKEAPLDKVFKAIEKQTDYIFFYNVDWVYKSKKVNVEVKDMQLQQVLELLFKNQPLSYSITGKMITVFPKKNVVITTEKNKPKPPINVHGKVVDENGKPVPGVTVTVRGTKKQTLTDGNGEFNLTGVDEQALLSFTTVNMEPFEITISGQTEIVAKLKTKTSQLDEVQVIAYGQTTKRLQTGNVTTIKSTDIEKQPVTNPLLALQGRVAGMEIVQSTGLPGSGITVRIRGRNSISQGNDPLYVVDGVPYTSTLLPNLGNVLGSSGGVPGYGNVTGNPLSYINPQDIESIEILKDADATAIYGSRGANGVVLITTKKGKSNKPTINMNFQHGIGKVTRQIDLLNTNQYLDIRHEALQNDGLTANIFNAPDLLLWDTTRYTDWQRELIGGSAKFSDLQASFSGGTPLTQYLIGSNYHKETTVFPGEFSDEKASFHLNLNSATPNQKFSIFLSINYQHDKNKLPGNDLTSYATRLAPNAPTLYNDDGSLNWAPNPLASGFASWTNPLQFTYVHYNNETNNLISNAVLNYNVLSGLNMKVSLGYTNLNSDEAKTLSSNYWDPALRPYLGNNLRSANYGDNKINSWIIEPQVNYTIKLGKGQLSSLLGATLQQKNSEGIILNASGFSSDQILNNVKAASSLTVNSYISAVYRYAALFGRINYDLFNKYLLSVNFRRDGTSRFGPDRQFHNFYSAAGAWVFSKENFIKRNVGFLSFGKLRGSYGTTGSDQVPDYLFYDLFSSTSSDVPYQGVNGLTIINHYNPDLAWEETKKLEVAVELGFLNDKILLSSSYYLNRSSNQLTAYSLSYVTGFSTVNKNLNAKVLNKGWEISLNTTNIGSRNFKWTTSLNLTFPKNRLLEVSPGMNSIYEKLVGHPLNSQFVYHFIGVDPTTGLYQIADKNGNPILTPEVADATTLIDLNPNFYGGLQNSFRYKSFQLDFLFQYVKQIGNNYFFGTYPGSAKYNQPIGILDRWQKPGDSKNAQILSNNYPDNIYNAYVNALNSDKSFSDASFARLKNISVSWETPERFNKKLRFNSLRFFVQGQNLFTITNYLGIDPETQSTTSLPPLRILTFGIQLSL